MSEHKSGPREGLEGVVEGIKGKAKEVAGVIVGDDDLQGEGRAQQDKADAQREAALKEAAAEKERAKAAVDEQLQRGYQQEQQDR
ncbi:CsbD family protein [Nocardia sp. NPDC020380]|uniref:microaggregate-binding protein 1 n=1 Tax=Nocardia sp. NPDC020380 TaxID=3364309 RepID=UPI0037A802F6